MPLIVTVMSEDSETDISTMLNNSEGAQELVREQQKELEIAADATFGIYLAIVSADSSVSYYEIADRSLCLAEAPRK